MAVLNYADYDFDNLVTNLQNRLRNRDAWKDIYRSSTGQMLLEALAAILNLGLYYTERRAQESFLSTAQLRSSVAALVSLINYSPKRKSSSTGNLTFTLAASKSNIVFIPKYTECQTSASLKFLTNESASISPGQTSLTVSAIQGELQTIEITADGSQSQEYLIRDTDVENSASTTNPTLRVTVDSEEWTLVTSFIRSDDDDKHYRIINEADGTVSVLFGDGINGFIPEANSSIVIKYVKTDGADGNVTFTDKVTTINDTIFDEDATSITDISVTNNGSFLGGDEEEDIEELRYEAPRVFKTGDRAVTKEDFIAILENFSGVAAVNVWGENEEAEEAGVAAVASMLNKIKFAIILQEWELPDQDFKDTIEENIYDQSMIAVKYEFVDPVILTVIPVMRVVVEKGYSLSQTQSDIDVEIAKFFVLGSTTKFGTVVKYSEIICAAHDLEAVDHVNLTLEIKKSLSSTFDSNYDWGEDLEATDIKPESVRLFFDDTYVVTDVDQEDGTGSFSSAGVYTISGTVNYSTGRVLLNVSPSVSTVHARYQQDSNQNITPALRQICRLDQSGVDFTSVSTTTED